MPAMTVAEVPADWYRPFHQRRCPARRASVRLGFCTCPAGQFGPAAVQVPLFRLIRAEER
jgi:hypothetical protein